MKREAEERDPVDDDSNVTLPVEVKRKKLTAQDVQVARETAELFKSNIFKLQIDELIKEVRLKETHFKLMEKVLHRLFDIIHQVPSCENYSLDQVENYFSSHKVAVPFPDPKPTNKNYKFSYVAPSDVSLVGSFGLRSGIQNPQGMSIDMALTMPSSLFEHKDYLNYRAFYKRAFYLAYLAQSLTALCKKNHLPVTLCYTYLNGDVLCPVINIRGNPASTSEEDLNFAKTKMSINLIVGFPMGVFDSKKLLPEKNCIRVADAENLPTPLYNSSLLSSTAYDYYLKYLYTVKKTADAFRDACVLGKVWLYQRGLCGNIESGGFGHFEFAMLMAALLQGGGEKGNKILLHGFSSYQLFKATISYLASQDLCDEGYLTFNSSEDNYSLYKNGGFHVPTLFDKHSKINILWKMSRSSYETLRISANDTLRMLNDVVRDRFDPIFLQKASSSWLKNDINFVVNVPQSVEWSSLEKVSFITWHRYICSKLHTVISKALVDRVSHISVELLEAPVHTFPLTKRHAPAAGAKFLVSLHLKQDEKLVTRGPDADSPDAAEFKAFWGSKVSLRRFKDGNIQHCCVWTPQGSEPLVYTISKYALQLHISAKTTCDCDASIFSARIPPPIVSHGFVAANNEFEKLSKIISSSQLPLSVKSVLASSPQLRSSSVLEPVPFAVSSPDFFSNGVLQFETSTKWPDQLEAVENTKAAFLLKLAAHLNNENYKTVFQREKFPYNFSVLLKVLSPDGFGFSFRVLTERDELLYLRAIEQAEPNQLQPARNAYLRFQQLYIGSVKHHHTISQLARHYTAFSPTVRLVKEWMDAHLLLTHFSEELVELLVMQAFVDPAPYQVPCSARTGFLRTLKFLSEWNWKETPLILDLTRTDVEESQEFNLSDKLSFSTYKAIQSNFERIRKSDPNAINVQMFVGSRQDPSGILWCNDLSLPVTCRLTALAKIGISIIDKESKASVFPSVLNLLFTPSMKDFDFVLDLKLSNVDKLSCGVMPQSAYKNLIDQQNDYPVDFSSKCDPVMELVSELNQRFDGVVIFFCHKYTALSGKGNENVIAGLFNPALNGERKFKVNDSYSVVPADDVVTINKDGIVNEVVRFVGDLVVGVDYMH